MSGAGRPAALPTPGWRPEQRRDGAVVLFVSQDGRVRKPVDLSKLPGPAHIREELAIALEFNTGPLGEVKEWDTVRQHKRAAQLVAHWVSQNRPAMESLAQLTKADARMLALGLKGESILATTRSLLGCCDAITQDVTEELARHRVRKDHEARQPYSDAELARICLVMRAVVRRARDRIRTHRAILADYCAGLFDHLDERDGLRCLGEALDYCDRVGDFPRTRLGQPTALVYRARARAGVGVMPALHLTGSECWAFSVLLAALTGLNASVLERLPAPYLQATTDDEQGIALVATNKPRRGRRARVTIPLTGVPEELHPITAADRPNRVHNTSLTTAYGVYILLLELTEPARRHLGSDRAFAHYRQSNGGSTGGNFADHIPACNTRDSQRLLHRWLTGDPEADHLLLWPSYDRLRKTRIELVRHPISHTPATYVSYLRKMRKVTEEGFGVVRDALETEVSRARARRKMTVLPSEHADAPAITAQDTVIGECVDFEHSPQDDGKPCRQTFFACLDCPNARALPRHLPTQLVVVDTLHTIRRTMSAAQWTRRYAGREAQLRDVLDEYTDAQRQAARAAITEEHHRRVDLLFGGDLDPV